MQFNNLNFKLRYDAGQQTKELKPGKEKSFREEAKKRKQRKKRKGIGDMQNL